MASFTSDENIERRLSLSHSLFKSTIEWSGSEKPTNGRKQLPFQQFLFRPTVPRFVPFPANRAFHPSLGPSLHNKCQHPAPIRIKQVHEKPKSSLFYKGKFHECISALIGAARLHGHGPVSFPFRLHGQNLFLTTPLSTLKTDYNTVVRSYLSTILPYPN